jgi:hypothetical protein
MPRIIVQAHTHGGDVSPATLSERVVAEHLGSNHYTTQLIERITWAVADAEALESRIGIREPDAEVPSAEGSDGHRISGPGRRSAAIPA